MQTFKSFSELKQHLDREAFEAHRAVNEADVQAAEKLRRVAPMQRANAQRNGRRGPAKVNA